MALTLVAVKLTPTELQCLDKLVEEGNYRSRSEFIRAAIMDRFRRAEVNLPTLNDIRLERVRHPQRKKKRPADDKPTTP